MRVIEKNKKHGVEYQIISFAGLRAVPEKLLSALQFLDTVEYYVLCFLYLISRPRAETASKPFPLLLPRVTEVKQGRPSHSARTPKKNPRRRSDTTDANPRQPKKGRVDPQDQPEWESQSILNRTLSEHDIQMLSPLPDGKATNPNRDISSIAI